MNKRIAGYVRVSTQEQLHGLSVDNQIDTITQYIQDNGDILVGIYSDAGISGQKRYTKRPALMRLLQDCKDGKVDTIAFTRLDRWFRSVKYYYEVQTILDECDVKWDALLEEYGTDSSESQFVTNIMLSVAQAEAQRTAEKVKSISDWKLARGDYVGKAPTGYVIKDKHLVIDESKREGVQAFFDAYLSYAPMRECLEKAAEHGVKLLRSCAYVMLKNPTYSGMLPNGECEAYITPKQFQSIQNRKKAYTRANKIDHDLYYFNGISYCATCGARMVGKQRHVKLVSGGVNRHVQYTCSNYYRDMDRKTCPGTYMAQDKLEQYLLEHLDTMLEAYTHEISKIVPEHDVESISKQKNALKRKLERVGQRFEDGDIDRYEYRQKRDHIKMQIAELSAQETEIPTPIKLPGTWKEIYEELNSESRREFWHRIIKRITIPRGDISGIEVEFL